MQILNIFNIKQNLKKYVFVTSHKCVIHTHIVIYYIKNKTLAFRK